METGELFTWGSCKDGILGLGEVFDHQYFPIKVIIDESQDDQYEIIDIVAGKSHASALCIKKEVDDNF